MSSLESEFVGKQERLGVELPIGKRTALDELAFVLTGLRIFAFAPRRYLSDWGGVCVS
jgi:hypothetical protein